MYKYTYNHAFKGGVILSGVEFDKNGVIVVRNRIEVLDKFVKEGLVRVEEGVSFTTPSVASESTVSSEETPKENLPPQEELDSITQAVLNS